MESLLSLSTGDFRAVELTLRLTMALVVMSSLMLALCVTCTASRQRFPLILASVALLGAAWFESGVWTAWKEGFELAGTSYCVTGQPLAGEDRIIAWSLAVPALLFCFELVRTPWGNGQSPAIARFGAGALLLGLLAPLSHLLALVLLGLGLWRLCFHSPAASKDHPLPIDRESRLAAGSILFAFLITLLGGWHLLPLGKSAGGILVRGEIIRSLCEILSLVVPSLLLLKGVLNPSTAQGDPLK
jgi:hypothetical protein